MAYEVLDEFVGKYAEEVDLVPVLFVHVPGGSDVGVGVAEFNGIVGVALQDEPFGFLQVNHGEDSAFDAKRQRGFIKREVLCCLWQRQAVVSNAFYVHDS